MDSHDPAVRIRAAGSSDIAALASVQLMAALHGFAHIFPDSVEKPTQEGLEAEWEPILRDPRQSAFVASVADEIVAGVAFGEFPHLTPVGWGHLARLYVLPQASGRGVGSLLYDHAIAGLREAGYRDLWLWVLEGNKRARDMYERRGWQPQSERRTDWPGTGIFEMGYVLRLGGTTRP